MTAKEYEFIAQAKKQPIIFSSLDLYILMYSFQKNSITIQ